MSDTRGWSFRICLTSAPILLPEIKMKLMILTATALALIATTANAKSVKKSLAPPPADRYFDAAHGPDDPHSVWLAGDYVGRDPDLAIRATMTRQPYN
jgi:hypothetical protein